MGNEVCSENYCGHCNANQTSQEVQCKTNVVEIEEHIQLPQLLPTVKSVLESKPTYLVEFTQKQYLLRRKLFGEDIYEGELNFNDLPHGVGKMYKSDGSLFVGKFQQGKAEGAGLYIMTDGAYFQGNLVHNFADCQNGKFCCNQYTYEGGFKDNVFHGEGKQTSEGSIFMGQFVNGAKNVGELRWWAIPGSQNQFCYYGKFDQFSKFTDDGILIEPTGKYTGSFLNGKKHGEGVYIYKTNLKYEGEYKDGEKEGKGRVSFFDKDLVIYDGNWKNGLPQGHGVKYDENGKKIATLFHEGINILTLINPEKLKS